MNHDEAIERLKGICGCFHSASKDRKALDYAIAQLERKVDYEPTDYEKAAIKNTLAKPADDGMV